MTTAKSNEIRDKIEELIGQHPALYQLLHYFESELSQESNRAVDEFKKDLDKWLKTQISEARRFRLSASRLGCLQDMQNLIDKL